MFSFRYFAILFFVILMISCASKKHITKNEKQIHTETKNILKTEIETWLNVPYKFGGNDKKGVDCSGFVNAIYLSVYKIKLPRTTKEIFLKSKSIEKEKLAEGNLVFFDIEGKGVSHVGIYLEKNNFVHASSSKGVVISSLDNVYYANRFLRGGKI